MGGNTILDQGEHTQRPVSNKCYLYLSNYDLLNKSFISKKPHIHLYFMIAIIPGTVQVKFLCGNPSENERLNTLYYRRKLKYKALPLRAIFQVTHKRRNFQLCQKEILLATAFTYITWTSIIRTEWLNFNSNLQTNLIRRRHKNAFYKYWEIKISSGIWDLFGFKKVLLYQPSAFWASYTL